MCLHTKAHKLYTPIETHVNTQRYLYRKRRNQWLEEEKEEEITDPLNLLFLLYFCQFLAVF